MPAEYNIYIRDIFFESWPDNLSTLYLRCKYFRDTILLADKKIIGSSYCNTRIVMLYKIIITQQWLSTCEFFLRSIRLIYIFYMYLIYLYILYVLYVFETRNC